jgi:hypothetical protein
MICEGNLALMGRITHGILVGKPKAKSFLEAIGLRGRIILKGLNNNLMGGRRLDISGSGRRQVAGSC